MTKEEKMREIFYRFLKKRMVYNKFMRNLRNPKIAGRGTIADLREDMFIDDGFVWGDSPEKHNYWYELDDEWNDILSQLKTKPTKEVEEYREFLKGKS